MVTISTTAAPATTKQDKVKDVSMRLLSLPPSNRQMLTPKPNIENADNNWTSTMTYLKLQTLKL